jgi:hypothetical protein
MPTTTALLTLTGTVGSQLVKLVAGRSLPRERIFSKLGISSCLCDPHPHHVSEVKFVWHQIMSLFFHQEVINQGQFYPNKTYNYHRWGLGLFFLSPLIANPLIFLVSSR